MPCLGRLRAEAVDELLHLLDAGLGPLDLRLFLLDGERLRALEGVVVARVETQLLVVEVGDRVADRVQEVAVVGDDDEGAPEVAQVAFDPLDRCDVEVVRRLVEQQQVGIGKERLREQHPQPEAARQLAHGPLVPLRLEAEAGEQRRRARLRLVAPLLGDRDLELAEPFARPGAHRLRLVAQQLLPLREGVPQDRVAHQHGVEKPEVVEPEVILAERPETQLGWADDAARLRGELPAHQAQQRRLPGPVRADQAVVAACTELPAHALVELLPAEGHPQVAERDHRASHAPRSERRRSMIAALGRCAKAGRGDALAARGPPSRRCQTGDR